MDRQDAGPGFVLQRLKKDEVGRNEIISRDLPIRRPSPQRRVDNRLPQGPSLPDPSTRLRKNFWEMIRK